MASYSFSAERVRLRHSVDPILLGTILLLTGTGLAILFSSSFFRAGHLFGDPYRFFRTQGLFTLLGALAAVLPATVSLERIRTFMPLMLLSTLVLMILTFVPGIGASLQGARRWIFVFGRSFQPSELVKLVMVVYLAHLLSNKRDSMDDAVNTLLPPFLVLGLFSILIYTQNDFSTAVFVFVLGAAMFFVAGAPIRYFLGLGVVTTPLAVILLLSREHRVRRLLAFLEPGLDPSGSGFQILAAERALVNGGAWGVGMGLGSQKMGALPEVHSDFIFAVVAEELGLFGVVAIIALYATFAWRGYLIALRAPALFESFLAFGVTTMIVLQAFMNIAVVGGAVPATGIPLPFFSSGGSSMLVTLVACGLLLNVSRSTTDPEELHG